MPSGVLITDLLVYMWDMYVLAEREMTFDVWTQSPWTRVGQTGLPHRPFLPWDAPRS